jgi:hypothetical protein
MLQHSQACLIVVVGICIVVGSLLLLLLSFLLRLLLGGEEQGGAQTLQPPTHLSENVGSGIGWGDGDIGWRFISTPFKIT